ncbi:hypothetical protein L249_6367 [Ophiocordyceps polyrhachis-furcata BCC 54312]|uniref:Uncharacterized protein n=1 Tax=Ophiocordyceps polyrhachis-furcata BCC 54312 TaxID=1330021 RepID=A0A367LJJ4_9HYPO|nr:hypothetical protein L249_6367 [Ophiocordyceps polyrhachis-furcata BCC 54312]
MPAVKPKLEKLSTPVTATFPSEIASATTATPLSALHLLCKPDPDFIKTPISPPSAYTDFLTKAMTLGSPAVGPDTDASSNSSPPSSPSSSKESPPTTGSAVLPASPYPTLTPMSAPPVGSFPSLRLSHSSSFDSPLSAGISSPFSARSVRPAFDWDAALKARSADVKHKPARASVRHIREVVTRTVTYTPKMDPAPRGKRRKLD